ncbi:MULTISPECIES: transposase [Lysinibacillus]|uniref:IS66 family transposase n=1 Tax=Lysinibacillus sp. FJAT-14222 TaxID=1932366 RepID=UPI000A581CB1|nr:MULTISPECIES: transposase [Lysinibacillus]
MLQNSARYAGGFRCTNGQIVVPITIVPVKLDPIPTETSSTHSFQQTAGPSCVIKTAAGEISFFNGVERRVIRKFFNWLEKSQFFGKNALATATEYTLNRRNELKAFLYNGQIEIDNNPAKNAILPTVIGRKNWLFSVSEAGAKANAICLSLAETAKANGIDIYKYLVKLLTDLPNLAIHQQPELLQEYMPWSESIRATYA